MEQPKQRKPERPVKKWEILLCFTITEKARGGKVVEKTKFVKEYAHGHSAGVTETGLFYIMDERYSVTYYAHEDVFVKARQVRTREDKKSESKKPVNTSLAAPLTVAPKTDKQ